MPEPETTTIYGPDRSPLTVLRYDDGRLHIDAPAGGMWLNREQRLKLIAALDPRERN